MTTTGARPQCRQCGARLRRDRSAGAVCDPCLRAGPGPQLVLPSGFYDVGPVRDALDAYDFGVVFRVVRAEQGWSQQRLGEFLDFDQGRISEIERGTRRLRDVRLVARVSSRLAIPAVRLGFTGGATVDSGANGRKGVSWMQRRDFVQHVAGLALGAAAAAGLDVERLVDLLPHSEPAGSRHIGAADVEVIEQATAAFKRQDFAHGSGLSGDAATAQLRSALPLLGDQMSAELRPRLLVAIAHLAMQAGYMRFDVNQHDAARRLWMIALELARETDHARGADLTTYVLYDMALQAVHLGRPDEALRLLQIGRGAAGGPHPVSASTLSSLESIQARAHALRGDGPGCDRALGLAAERFHSIDTAARPPWGTSHDDTHLAARQGAAHYALALTGRDPRAAGRAVPLFSHAVDHFGPGYAKHRALYLPDLAGAHALAGNVDTAVTVGHQALEAVTTVSSPRVHDRLRTLHTALEPVHASPGVAELRGRLAATAA